MPPQHIVVARLPPVRLYPDESRGFSPALSLTRQQCTRDPRPQMLALAAARRDIAYSMEAVCGMVLQRTRQFVVVSPLLVTRQLQW